MQESVTVAVLAYCLGRGGAGSLLATVSHAAPSTPS